MEEVRLWSGTAPGSESWTHEESTIDSNPACPGAITNVVVPTVFKHRGEKPSDHAVVVIPGGGFRLLSMVNEGHQVADYLVERGIDAYVVKYRVVPTPTTGEPVSREAVQAVIPLAVADARQAMAVARQDGHRHVSVVGFSAGARVAAELATSADAEGPDAAGVIYPPRSLPDPVSTELPPLFLAVAADDTVTGIDGTRSLYDLWSKLERPVEMHLFERGGHGFGMWPDKGPASRWSSLFVDWLQSHFSEE